MSQDDGALCMATLYRILLTIASYYKYSPPLFADVCSCLSELYRDCRPIVLLARLNHRLSFGRSRIVGEPVGGLLTR